MNEASLHLFQQHRKANLLRVQTHFILKGLYYNLIILYTHIHINMHTHTHIYTHPHASTDALTRIHTHTYTPIVYYLLYFITNTHTHTNIVYNLIHFITLIHTRARACTHTHTCNMIY